MRHLAQYLIPALVLLVVVWVAARRSARAKREDGDGSGAFLAIFIVGALAAIALLLAIQGHWGSRQ